MKTRPNIRFLVTRYAGHFCSENGEKPWNIRNTTSMRDWAVLAFTHAEAIRLAGGPTIAPGDKIWDFRTPDGEEPGVFETWKARTIKELIREEDDQEEAMRQFREAQENPGAEILDPHEDQDSIEKELAEARHQMSRER